jgi:hypothetical protein
MPEVRDELARLAAGRDGDTTTILLARTDVGSAAPGRTRTTSFPAGAAAAAVTPAPAGPPPPPPTAASPAPAPAASAPLAPPEPAAAAPPLAPPRPPREGGRRRRGRALWVAAALVALVLAGLIAFWAIDPLAGDSSNASGSSAATPSAAATTTAGASTPSASAATKTSAASSANGPAAGQAVRAQDVDKAVKDFFKDIPKNLDAAYARTSPAFQSRFPKDGFVGFWSGFQDVKVSNIQTQDGSMAATVDIEYIWSADRRQTERHVITFVPGGGGGLLLNNDDGQGVIG